MEEDAGFNAPVLAQQATKGDRLTKGNRLDRPAYFAGDGGDTGGGAQKSSMPPATVDAITRAANEAGEDPAFALAVAERESNGRPNAHSSRTIYGIYQMRGDLRHQYGAGDSSDPYEQAQGWMRFIGDTREDMTRRLGREPTNGELYLAHHFGNDRAAHMISGRIAPSTPTGEVFSPYEMAINPHFGHAGTVGNLTSSIENDIDRRAGKYGGNYPSNVGAPIDFSSWGDAPGPLKFSQWGEPLGGKVDLKGNNGAPEQPQSSPQAPSGDNPPPAPAIDQGSTFGTQARPGADVDLSQIDFSGWGQAGGIGMGA